jgi:hypothetical protein
MTSFTPIFNETIRHKGLNDQQFRTYCMIMEHCWNPDTGTFDWSEPMSMKKFAEKIGRPRTTLIEHVNVLRALDLLTIYYYSNSTFTLNPSLSVGQPTQMSVSRPISFNKNLDSINREVEVKKKKNVGAPTGVGQPTVNEQLANFLRARRVGDPTRTQIATSGVSMSYVKAWFNYYELKGEPENNVIRYALAAIRDELPEPNICPVCRGIDGEHRGVMDEENFYQMCPREDYPDLSAAEIFHRFGEFTPV